MKIIINCDDLGMSQQVNEAIFDLMRAGRATSATMMMNGPALKDAAVRLGEFRNCSFGVHLNATEFAPLTSEPGLQPLLKENGEFAGNLRAVSMTAKMGNALLTEWSAQVERALALDVPVSHLDSHHHVHTHPSVFALLKRVQQRFGIRKVRLSRNVYGLAESVPARLRATKLLWNLALRYYLPAITTNRFAAFATFYDRLEAGERWSGSIELMVYPGGEESAAETALLWGDWKNRLAPDAKLISYNELS